MNYRVRRQGQDLGLFPLEELRRRREAGEFNGGEYVQGEGMTDWQPLDLVLQQGHRLTPPPLPSSIARNEPNQALIWGGIAAGIVLCLVIVIAAGVLISKFQKAFTSTINQARRTSELNEPNPEGVALAGKPILWNTNTQTYADQQKRATEFRIHEWLDGYDKRSDRNPKYDAEADAFIRAYTARDNSGLETVSAPLLSDESDKLANVQDCDPLVLTLAADQSLNQFDAMHRFDRALLAYPGSKHEAYPRFYAMVRLADLLGERSDRTGELETSALQMLKECFADGSFTPEYQQDIGEFFVYGWGKTFFGQNAASVCSIVKEAGTNYQWLALTLDGDREINAAWAARGEGYANEVTSDGWRGFHSDLSLAAGDLTSAWNLRPNWPLAPCLMMTVSLGDSGLEDMRTWFDRTTQAEIDYPKAWSELRWGLRPRWYGSLQAILAFGAAAVNSGRFDTEVPHDYFYCVQDVESELGLSAGQHIYDRPDVWPNLKRMYEGYIAAPSEQKDRDGWRTSYAVVAYFARQYDTARAQLEALNWKPLESNMKGWNFDLSLMPLEVAARTGPLGNEISVAEIERNHDEIPAALKKYTELKDSPQADERTREFIQRRLSELSIEDHLQKREWVSLLPTSDDDPNWVFSFGKAHVLPDGALEVESGPKGHMLFSRIRAGMDFEVRGQFELVHSSNQNFQGGVVIGMPEFDGYGWYGFRLKRHGEEGDVVSFSSGWSRNQITQHVVLNDVTNSFDMIFDNGKVTASVNGVSVFDHATPMEELNVPDNSCLIGLGAFNDSADTIIRYRNVQLRKF
jgi:hypothetical protein